MNTANLLKIHHGENGALFCDSRDMAMHLGIAHKNLLETIRKHQTSIESYFEHIAFQTSDVRIGNGAIRKDITHALLTEIQATFIATLSRNTPRVIEFKATLVTSFYRAREAMQAVQLGSMGAKSPKDANKASKTDQAGKSVFNWLNDLQGIDVTPIELDLMCLEETCQTLLLSKVKSLTFDDFESVGKVLELHEAYQNVIKAVDVLRNS